MVTEFTNGKMAIGMKDPGIIVSNTEKVLIYLLMGTYILGLMSKANLKAKESTNGKMAPYIRGSSKMALKTEKANGCRRFGVMDRRER